VTARLAQFEGGPLDGRTGEYDLDDEAVFFDCESSGPAAVYRRSGETALTARGQAVVYVYLGPALLG
jgi:hypothetical protein